MRFEKMTPALDVNGNVTGKNIVTGYCDSSETKPKKFATGSKMIETDTGKLFLFNEKTNEWEEF